MDHRGAPFEALGRRSGQFVRARAAAPGWSAFVLRPPFGATATTTRPRASAATAFSPFLRSPERVDWPPARTQPLTGTPMTHILHRSANVVLPVAVSGSGLEIVDADGRRISTRRAARRSPALATATGRLAAMHGQLDALAYAHTAFFTSQPAERLADRLIEDARRVSSHVYLVSGGSEGDRGGAEDGAAVFCRDRPAAAPPCHCAAAELSRQHAGRAGGRRQHGGARTSNPS